MQFAADGIEKRPAAQVEEADRACARMLEAMDRNEALYECYDPLTGVGNGHPEFMWSAAAVLVAVKRHYAATAFTQGMARPVNPIVLRK